MLCSVLKRFVFLRTLIVALTIVLLPFSNKAQQPGIDSLLNVLKAVKTDSSRSEIYNALSKAAFSANYGTSLEYAQQAAFFAKKTGSHHLLMNAYKSIASVFITIGVLDQAVTYFNLSGDEAVKAGDQAEALKNKLNLGLVYMALGDFKKALSIYEQSEGLLNRIYAKKGEAVPLTDQITVQLNIGLSYTSLGNFSKGDLYFDRGIALAGSDRQYRLLKARLLLAKADGLLKQNNTSAAYTLVKQAETILRSLQEVALLVVAQSFIASIEERNANYRNAITLYSQLYQEATRLGSNKMMKEFSQLLYKNYDRMRDSDSAVKYLSLYNQYYKQEKESEAKAALIRKELIQQFAAREQALVEKHASVSRVAASIFLAVVLLLGVLYWRLMLFRTKYRKADLQKLKIQLEAERLELEQKQLMARIADQEMQLADLSYAISKNAMLENLVSELQLIGQEQKEQKAPSVASVVAAKDVQHIKIWEEFEVRFLKTHAGFFDRLMTDYPGLTVNERRLCAFLRLDMTTKEISVITGQSIRAIEIARTRLRKKLNLTETEKTLFEHLSSI